MKYYYYYYYISFLQLLEVVKVCHILFTPLHQQVNALVLICRDGDYEEGAQAIHRLGDAMEKIEPKNTQLYLENAQVCF